MWGGKRAAHSSKDASALFQDAQEEDDASLRGDGASSVSRYSQGGGSADGGGAPQTAPAAAPVSTLTALQAGLLALLAAASWAVACSGTALLAWLLVSRMYLPARIEWERPLYFDYSASPSTAVALVPLTADPDTAPSGFLADPSAPRPGAPGAVGAWSEEFPLLGASDAGGGGATPAAGATGGGAAAVGSGAGARLLLAPGRRASVSVHLRVPPARDADLFQVTGELLAADGRLLGRSARTYVPRRRALVPWLVRYALTAPWAAIGLYDDSEHVTLQLFDGFGVPAAAKAPGSTSRKRRRSSSGSGGGEDGGGGGDGGSSGLEAASQQPPLPAYFRAKLVGRSPAVGPPRIYSADMLLRLQLGWIESFLFHLSPGPILAVVMLASGAAMALGGGGFAGALLIAAVAAYRWGTAAAEKLARAQRQAAGAAGGDRAAASGGAGGGGSEYYGAEEEGEEEDASSGQWTPVQAYGGNGGGGAGVDFGPFAAAESRVAGGRGGGGGDSGGEGGAGVLEPASPLEGPGAEAAAQQWRSRGGGGGSGIGGGAAVAAIRSMVGAGKGGGGEQEEEEEEEEGGEGGAPGGDGGRDESWQHIVAGSDSPVSPQRAAALNRRRGWPFAG